MKAQKVSKKDMAKKRNALPKFNTNISPYPVNLVNSMMNGLKDSFDMDVSGTKITVDIKEMELINKLGEGQFGVVEKMRHTVSGLVFAVKKIRCSMDEKEQSRMLNDLNISLKGAQCQFLIESYGAMFHGGEVAICMEVFDICLDKLYNKVPLGEFVPESLLAYITFSMVSALEFLHRELKVIHRDVKPSNVLLDCGGRVKVCDFGISGFLINSLVETNVGSQPYLAPERIDPDRSSQEYGIRSDVWSLGLSVLEVAIRHFPFPKWGSLIDQLRDVVHGETSPSLPDDSPYSSIMRAFISRCLVRKVSERAKYDELLKHKMLKKLHSEANLCNSKTEMASYVARVIRL